MFFKNKYITLSFYLVFFILLQSCAPRQKPPQVFASLREQPQVERALQTLRAQAAERQNLSGLVDIEIQARGRWKQMQAAFHLKAPNQLSLNFLDDFGLVYARLEADGQQVEWWESTQEFPEIYPQNGDVLNKIFGIKMSVQEFIDRLLLKLPESQATGTAPNKKETIEVTQIVWPQGIATVATEPPQLLKWVGTNVNEQKKRILYQARYYKGNSDENRGVNYPEKIVWLFQRPKARVTMEFSEIK